MFYVYELFDPADGAVFYVGKGKDDRVGDHEREARRGVVHPKCDRIRKIWARKAEVGRRIVQEFQDESAAYEFEASLIARYGIENLTNIGPGGGGSKRPETVILDFVAACLRRSKGWSLDLAMHFCGKEFDVTARCKGMVSRFLNDLVEKRGIQWVKQELGKRQVILTLPSEDAHPTTAPS